MLELLFVTILVLYGIGGLLWLGLSAAGFVRRDPEREWGPEDVQARVLTIGDVPGVVQDTVDALPDDIDDVRVITEQAIEIDGATVHVVPDDYDCRATNKGRAIQWALEHVPCDSEYVLYLDEDSQVQSFRGLPDADVVQLQEQPRPTNSMITWLTDVFRVGWQAEMQGFPHLTYPCYLWGGGFAVRHDVEQRVGWNWESITEDTAFLWAAIDAGCDYTMIRDRVANQSPPSMRALLEQRRRWFVGTFEGLDRLPTHWAALIGLRQVLWVVSTLGPLVLLAGWWLDAGLIGALVLWNGLLVLPAVALAGSVRYERARTAFLATIVVTVLSIPLSACNGLGTLYGLLDRPETFTVTEKVDD